MPLFTLTSKTSRQARRALGGAVHNRIAQLVLAGLAGGGIAAAATRAALSRNGRPDSDGPSRTYRLRRKEKPAQGMRRIAGGRAADALDQLRYEADGDFAAAVHEARKDLKKLRSALRLVRDELGDDVYARENERFRDTGRSLSGPRDAEVKLETLDSLRERFAERLSSDSLAPFVAALRAERDRHAEEVEVEKAVAELEGGRALIASWPLDANDWNLFAPGLKRSYRRGRSRFADVRDAASDEAIHEWRKRVKDLWYQLRILRNSWKPVLGETADQAHELADLLGDHHDLAVLREDALGRRELIPPKQLDELLVAIDKRQGQLTADAIVLGRRIYAEKPKLFERRLRSYWGAWR
jgi:CHAD domain-containing protein